MSSEIGIIDASWKVVVVVVRALISSIAGESVWGSFELTDQRINRTLFGSLQSVSNRYNK
jgi:hypothetical protein